MEIYKTIKEKKDVFIVAEIGVNYYDIAKIKKIKIMDAAKLMIDNAIEGGADAVKFQSFKADKIASKNSPAYWNLEEEPTDSQYKLFKKFDKLGHNEFKKLSNYCNKNNIIFMSTPFDVESADYLCDLMLIYKISSSDITNLPFIEYIAKKGKPVFLSTGASSIGEIDRAINIITKTGNNKICILHCILDYPTKYENANLNMIKHLKNIYPDFLIGYSDHTKADKSMQVLTTSYLFGAKVIEKHFTLDKTIKGNDHYHAMDKEDLKRLKLNIKLIKEIRGNYYKKPLDCEKKSRLYARRSLVAKININKNEKITREKLTFKRPGTGISPSNLDKVIGRQATRDINKDELIQWENI